MHTALEIQQHRPGGLYGVGVGPPASGAVRDAGPFFLIQLQPDGPAPPPAAWEAAQAPPSTSDPVDSPILWVVICTSLIISDFE